VLSPNGHIKATRLHPRIHAQKGRRGMWVSAGLGLRGREDHQQRGGGSPRLCGGGKVRCRWRWLVALLIDKGAPKVA
jgi:hypothetical protein